MAPTTASPNVENLQVGKGVVSFKKTGDSLYRDLGNVSELKVTPEVETLEHFTSRTGTKKKDLVITIEQKCTVVMTLEEFTPENVALMLQGTVDLAAGGGAEVDIFNAAAVQGALKFVGTNDVGPKITLDLYNVSFSPNGDLGMISDEFNNMEVTGDVLAAPGLAAIKATGVYTATIQLANADTITIGANVYTFDTALAATPNHVKIGADLAATLANLAKAINLNGIAGTDYGVGTTQHPSVTATSDATHVNLTAKAGGTAGNAIATTDTSANGAFGAVTLTGGVAGDPNAGKFGIAKFTNMTISP